MKKVYMDSWEKVVEDVKRKKKIKEDFASVMSEIQKNENRTTRKCIIPENISYFLEMRGIKKESIDNIFNVSKNL